MTAAASLAEGREYLRRHAWGDAFACLTAADAETPLQPEDLERLAECAQLLGRYAESDRFLTRLHQESLAAGDARGAARAAFKLGMSLITQGEAAQSGGWLARARRLLEDAGDQCVEQGYLLLPVARQHLLIREAGAAYAAFEAAATIGTSFGDRDLVAFARHGMGRAMLQQGDLAGGTSLLDEAMVAVLAGEVTPLLAGIIYCSVIEACHQIFDLGRAREWTAALTEWCASQPDLVSFRGNCRLHRAELLQLRGDWSEALEQATGAEALGGEAFYRMGEVHRLRGEFPKADQAYREAGERGRTPYPGLALLRLAQGQVDAAVAAIRAAVGESPGTRDRSVLLSASVEIHLAASDLDGARAASQQLSAIAGELAAPYLLALSAHAAAAVLLAEDQPSEAQSELHRAGVLWQQLEAPYEAARVRVLTALASRAMGDEDRTGMELAAASRVFRRLGAGPDLARVETLSVRPAPIARGTLTAREVEVLRLVASGAGNRGIALELGISEKTVARHLSNIFTKLGLTSRGAATAWAYQSGLARIPAQNYP